jgi:hypothetical protein
VQPCPFCGHSSPEFSDGYVVCSNCGASSHHFDTPDEAIEAWNCRASLPAVQGEQPSTSAEKVQGILRTLAAMNLIQDSRPASVAPGGQPLAQADEREAFDAWAEDQVGPGASRRWLKTEAYENSRVQDYRTGWLACLQRASGLVDPVVPTPEPPGATLSPGAGTKREPLTEGQIASLIEAAWDRAELATARGDESPETEWTRYGTLVARAVESAHGIDVLREASQVEQGESSGKGGESC